MLAANWLFRPVAFALVTRLAHVWPGPVQSLALILRLAS
jgi:hypothetical protein